MKLMRKDIRPNSSVTTFFALESIHLATSRDQRHFLVLSLYDKTGRIKGYIWNEPEETATRIREKSFVKVKGIARTANDSLALNIDRIRMAEKHEIDIRDFLEVVSGGIGLWQRKLFELVSLIKNGYCRQLINEFLKDSGFMEQFSTSPAGIWIHHNYIGGLLEHTVNIMTNAASMADCNPALVDKDLMLTGSFLHDIGKTREIYWEIGREYTTEGRLLGHISIGVSLLEDKISKLRDFSDEIAVFLKHMILSHHGQLEYGSPVKPATPEAIALHLLDSLDARINHLYCHLGNSNPDAVWSHFDKYLNTEIYQRKLNKRTLKEIKEVAA
jgi:3'-5' exoribonuclease